MAVAKGKKRAKRRTEIAEIMSPQAQKKAEREIRHALGDLDDRADEYAAYAKMILDANPPEIRQIVEAMTEKMRHMQGQAHFSHNGIRVNIEPEVVQKINDKIHTWVAVRLLVACAECDIQVGKFQLPKNLCYRCGKKVRRHANT